MNRVLICTVAINIRCGVRNWIAGRRISEESLPICHYLLIVLKERDINNPGATGGYLYFATYVALI
jgi:hypothetical protein